MKTFFALVLIAFQATAAPAVKHKIPLKPGTYTFRHRFAEQPNLGIGTVLVTIKGGNITVFNPRTTDVFPKGVLAQGKLVWHQKSKQWIIAEYPSDKDAQDVGGCSEGPDVVDLQNRIYWTC